MKTFFTTFPTSLLRRRSLGSSRISPPQEMRGEPKERLRWRLHSPPAVAIFRAGGERWLVRYVSHAFNASELLLSNGPFAASGHMLKGKLPTGASKTKKIQIYLDEVALFWMSQWAACPPACTMWPLAAKGPLTNDVLLSEHDSSRSCYSPSIFHAP